MELKRKMVVFVAVTFLMGFLIQAEPTNEISILNNLKSAVIVKNYSEVELILKNIPTSMKSTDNYKLADDVFIIMTSYGIHDYKIIKLYMQNLNIYHFRNALILALLMESGSYYFSKLVDEGVITENDFTFSTQKNQYVVKNLLRNPICMLGSYGYNDLVREYIYKNKTPYSKCGASERADTELFYVILANDLRALTYVLENGFIQYIGLNFEKELGIKYFKGNYMESDLGEVPKAKYPLEISLLGDFHGSGYCKNFTKSLPSFEIIKLLIDKGARGISKKKAFELLEKTKSNRKPEEYEKIKQYLQKNYPDDKPLKKPASN